MSARTHALVQATREAIETSSRSATGASVVTANVLLARVLGCATGVGSDSSSLSPGGEASGFMKAANIM
jgi:hypothetical protein